MKNTRTAYGTVSSLALALLLGGAGTVAAEGLPGGATSINETHADWTVACRTTDGTVQCVVSQVQVSAENNQRLLSVQMSPIRETSAAQGVLIMPFGLRLDAGVRLAIDEDTAPSDLRFSTCLPAGCVVPLDFDAATVGRLKSGSVLRATATANEGAQEVAFSVPLAGLASALERAAELLAY